MPAAQGERSTRRSGGASCAAQLSLSRSANAVGWPPSMCTTATGKSDPWSLDGLESLCRRCHGKHHQERVKG